ncbi:MAG: IS3 family transposase [Ktedonobacteraceae bacterium]
MRLPSTNARDARLSALIQQLFQEHRQVYGSPRIHAVLAAMGIHVGRKRVVRLMQALGREPRCPRSRDRHSTRKAILLLVLRPMCWIAISRQMLPIPNGSPIAR